MKGKGRGQDGASADQPMDFDEMQVEADAKGLPTSCDTGACGPRG